MLRIRTKLEASRIPNAGIGLFAAEPVKAGTVVWLFEEDFDLLLPAGRVAKRYAEDPIFRDLLPRVAYLRAGDTAHYLFVLDDSRFMNHAKAPNCRVDADGTVIALNDIAMGEEMTCDYDSFAPDALMGWMPGDGEAVGRNA